MTVSSKTCIKIVSILERNKAASSAEVSKLLKEFEATCSDYLQLGLVLMLHSEEGKKLSRTLFKLGYQDGEGNLEAGFQYSKLLMKSDSVETFKILHRLSSKGHAVSSYVMALEAIKDAKHKEALRLLNLSVDQGNAQAHTALANLYFVGGGLGNLIKRDMKKVFYHAAIAYEKGDSKATPFLCNVYTTGDGLPDNKPDPEKSFEFLKIIAETGVANAQWNLGALYLERKEPLVAIEYLKMAGEQRIMTALLTLGTFYEKGLYVDVNRQLAAAYYDLAINAYNTKSDSYEHMKQAQDGLKRIRSTNP